MTVSNWSFGDGARHDVQHRCYLDVETAEATNNFRAVAGDGYLNIKVRDQGSRNGTIVNGERVKERVLNHGDRIMGRQYEFHFPHGR
jgi:pSer/pThr/pTyr-binding forkhead associated (FHA) protein